MPSNKTFTPSGTLGKQFFLISNLDSYRERAPGKVRLDSLPNVSPFTTFSLNDCWVHCSLSDSEPPKIRVPRYLRQTYIRKVGEVINLQIPFQGKPKPQVTWTHNGHALDTQRVNVRNGEQDSILFIRSAQRNDSGHYELSVRLDDLEAKAEIDILVIERPGPPKSIKLLDVWGFNAALEWTPPEDTGNTELLGYTVQKADRKTGQWFTVFERCHRTSCTVSDLIIGNSYSFRVFSENQCGLSATAPVTTELAHIQKADTVSKKEGIQERDFSEAPKFTHPLADHTTTLGYSTQLFCSVRATPKPKIIWMKNKMDIQGNPKYRALSEQGICSLEIRKPSPFDAGVYTCKAINALGEASVDCRLDVKGEGFSGKIGAGVRGGSSPPSADFKPRTGLFGGGESYSITLEPNHAKNIQKLEQEGTAAGGTSQILERTWSPGGSMRCGGEVQ
uniref:Myosin-binding protein H n=1 Tax=Sarcophilus harrisii TaxID=9305 RepID=A0A7N4PY38_SARHA